MTVTQLVAMSVLVAIGATMLVSGLAKLRTMAEHGDGVLPGGAVGGGLLLLAIVGMRVAGLVHGIDP